MIRAATLRKALVPARIRAFCMTPSRFAATAFKMPAMSPTMEEGGIIEWKFQPGEAFTTGDVLLEIETDKATIDVEAQDDGILAKILLKDGDKKIPVGQTIAFLAEEGDVLADLDYTVESAAPATPAPKEIPKETPKAAVPVLTPAPAPTPTAKPPQTPAKSGKSASVFGPANAATNHKLLPSVELLLHKNHISQADAIAKIPASGPKGRLLFGDVLAYLGQASADNISFFTLYLQSKEHLDLSNIVLRVPEAPKATKPAKVLPPTQIVRAYALPIAQTQNAGGLAELLDDCYEAASEAYDSRYRTKSALVDPVFEELLQAGKSDAIVMAVEVLDAAVPPKAAALDLDDLFDDLMSLPTQKTVAEAAVTPSLKITVNISKSYDGLDRARFFIDAYEQCLKDISEVSPQRIEDKLV
ncbi:hypothetical protein BABINDRAFT_160669, partial [Babjeviella inositovora NRRL Y-12698]